MEMGALKEGGREARGMVGGWRKGRQGRRDPSDISFKLARMWGGSPGYWVCVGADNGGRKAGREQCEQGTERGKPEMERGWKAMLKWALNIRCIRKGAMSSWQTVFMVSAYISMIEPLSDYSFALANGKQSRSNPRLAGFVPLDPTAAFQVKPQLMGVHVPQCAK
jgi:hypothetical protein